MHSTALAAGKLMLHVESRKNSEDRAKHRARRRTHLPGWPLAGGTGRTPSFASVSDICNDIPGSPPTYLKRHVILCVYTHSARGTPRLAVRPRSTLQPQAVTAPHSHQAVRLSVVRQMRSISEGAKPPSARGVSAFAAGVRINPFAHSIQEPMIKSTAGRVSGIGVARACLCPALLQSLG